MSRLLIEEPPLQVLPSLAVAIGLHESLILQQIHYWLQRNGKDIDGRLWTYNSYPEWQKQFPFFSERTIQRLFRSLEEKKLLVTGNYNKLEIDRTKWYSIDYEELSILEYPKRKHDVTITTDCRHQDGKMSLPIPKTPTKTTSDMSLTDFFETLWKLYPRKEGKGGVSKTQKEKLHKIGLEEMTRAVSRYIKAKEGTDKKYLQMGSTFFNSGYVDYLDENYQQSKPVEHKPVQIMYKDRE